MGVSLSSAEFGSDYLPGTYGTHYIYPNQQEVDYFMGKGMNILRMPFRWERLQRSLNGEFDSTEFERFDAFVSQATAKGVVVLLDPHNYARYDGKLVGSAEVPNSAFADFWRRLAEIYKGNSLVMFGLMNEPHTMPTEQWVSAANAAAAAIRETGATNVIMVPGNAWSGAHGWYHNWYGTPNATAMLDYVDPGNNSIIEVHQYFDSDYSGTDPQCALTDASQVLADFTSWLATNNYRGFLGEFAGADNAACKEAIDSAIQYMQNNSEYWAGWSWWAAGPWWTWQDYMYSLEPAKDGSEAPQWPWLEPYLK